MGDRSHVHFTFTRNLQNVFQSGWTVLLSQQQCVSSCGSPSCLCSTVFDFLILLFCWSKQQLIVTWFSSIQFSCSVMSLCDPINCRTTGLSVYHQLPESTQTHVHRVSDAFLPSHPLSSPSPPAPNPSQHQGLSHCNLKFFFSWLLNVERLFILVFPVLHLSVSNLLPNFLFFFFPNFLSVCVFIVFKDFVMFRLLILVGFLYCRCHFLS